MHSFLSVRAFATHLSHSGGAVALAALLGLARRPHSEFWVSACLVQACAPAITVDGQVNAALAASSERLPHPDDADAYAAAPPLPTHT